MVLAMNRIDRLMAMVLFLQGRRITRAEDLADHFEISLRTVYRDIAALGEAGVPIVAEAGVGYSLMRGYHVPPVMFTAEEAGALATAGVLTRQMTDGSIDDSMRSALLKIRAVLPAEQQCRLERIEESTRLNTKPQEGNRVSILALQSALAESRVVRISYQAGGRGEITQRGVEPLGLVYYLAHWHLVAWCQLREDVRDFRLDRILNVEVGNERFTAREGVSLQSVIEQDRSVDSAEKVVVRFDWFAADRARREWSLGIIDDQPDAGREYVELTLTTGSLDWMVGWLLSFQTSAKVISPPEMREKLRSAALKIAEGA